jgi:DNA-binding LytR/AlgR family response regulator
MKSAMPLAAVFWITMMRTHIISTITAFAGYSLGTFFKEKTLYEAIPFTLAGTLCASVIAYLASLMLENIFFNISLEQSVYHGFSRMMISILTISAVITVITTLIERLRLGKAEIEKDLHVMRQIVKETGKKKPDAFSIKDGEAHHIIKHDEIIYLSSHGKKTSFHTVKKDYETNQLLKDIEIKLPDHNFIRIHKQFIINTRFLLKIQYYEGGRYMAYLKDEDESRLPVGRKFVPLLKSKLGISI